MIAVETGAPLCEVTLHLNGSKVQTCVGHAETLVETLRERLGLTGTHVGCDSGQCGACTVLLDGRAVRACTIPTSQVGESEIHTIEGLGEPDRLHPLQDAFIHHRAVQCGFCTPGMLMTAVDLMSRTTGVLSDSTIRQAIAGNLCRCTGYQNIVEAIADAAQGCATRVSIRPSSAAKS